MVPIVFHTCFLIRITIVICQHCPLKLQVLRLSRCV